MAAVQASNDMDDLEEGNRPDFQQDDAQLAQTIRYLEEGTLPQEDRLAQKIAMTSSRYVIEDRLSQR